MTTTSEVPMDALSEDIDAILAVYCDIAGCEPCRIAVLDRLETGFLWDRTACLWVARNELVTLRDEGRRLHQQIQFFEEAGPGSRLVAELEAVNERIALFEWEERLESSRFHTRDEAAIYLDDLISALGQVGEDRILCGAINPRMKDGCYQIILLWVKPISEKFDILAKEGRDTCHRWRILSSASLA